MPKSHDQIADQFEDATKTPYNRGKGADFKGKGFVAEVEPTPETFTDGIVQLKNYGGRRYLVTDNSYIRGAVERTKDTKIGVRKPNGTIVKPATPARRKK